MTIAEKINLLTLSESWLLASAVVLQEAIAARQRGDPHNSRLLEARSNALRECARELSKLLPLSERRAA